MYISKVISFRNSWNNLVEENNEIYNELIKIFSEIDLVEIERKSSKDTFSNSFRQNLRTSIEKDFLRYKWKVFDERINNMRLLIGNYKKNISCKYVSNNELLNKLIYTDSLIAYKNSIINLPIMIILDITVQTKYMNDYGLRLSHERLSEEFKALQPLGHSAPFLIISLTNEKTNNIELFELVAERETINENITINRCIEFPPHLKQAGLGILTYFGTVIDEKYPDHNSKVSIEQEGNIVRLVIETETGDKEIIEKVLEEYSLVVTNQKAPEDFFENPIKIIELKTELDMAYIRLESANRFIKYQENENNTLTDILKNLSKQEHPIVINNINTNNNHIELKNEFTINIPEIISDFKHFVSESEKFPDVELEILELNESLENLENKKEPEQIKNSTALKKLKRFLDESNEQGTKIEELINTVENGYEKVKNIGKKYNSIAKWCGAPIIPFFES